MIPTDWHWQAWNWAEWFAVLWGAGFVTLCLAGLVFAHLEARRGKPE